MLLAFGKNIDIVPYLLVIFKNVTCNLQFDIELKNGQLLHDGGDALSPL